MDNEGGVAITETCIVTHASIDMTGRTAYKSLKRAGFMYADRYSHNGSAAMDASGRYFDHYTG